MGTGDVHIPMLRKKQAAPQTTAGAVSIEGCVRMYAVRHAVTDTAFKTLGGHAARDGPSR